MSYLNLIFLAVPLFANKNNSSQNSTSNEIKRTIDNNDKKIKLSLDNLEKIFSLNNKDLKIYKNKIDQSQSSFKAQLALWSPKLILNSTNLPSYVSGYNNNKSTENTASETLNSSLNINLEWDLIDFSRTPNIKISKLNLEKAKLAYKVKYRELYTETLEVFLRFKSSNEEIKVANQAIGVSKITLKDAKDRFKGGIGNKLEVLEAETQLRKDQQLLATKIGESQKNKNLLLNKLNLNGRDISLDDKKLNLVGIWSSSIKSTIEKTKNTREEFKDLEIDQLINKNNGYLISSANKPKISIFNTYTVSSVSGESDVANPDNSKNTEAEENTVGMKFNWTLFDGGKTRQNYKSTKQREEELEIFYKVIQEQIINDIRNKFIDLNVSIKNILRSYQQIISAQEALNLALMRLRAGVTNQREVVSNLSDLTDSRSRYIQAVTNYNINIEKLKLSTGIKEINTCKKFIDNKSASIQDEIYKIINFELLKEICENNVLQKL